MTGSAAPSRVTSWALARKLAARELRAGFSGFRIFIACLALGVAAIAGVGSLSEAVVAGLRADARTLLGADIDLRLRNRPPTEEQAAYLESHAAATSAVMAMRAMAHPAPGRDTRSLVELKAVDGAYPLVGDVALDPPMSLAEALAERNGVPGAVADANLLTKLGIELRDKVRVGDAVFQVRATVVKEPDRVVSLFSLGPRLMVAHDAVKATGLVQPGSQIRYHTRILLPPGMPDKTWIERLKNDLPKAGWRIRGTDQAAPGIQRFIERMTLFLSFVGLTALLVGGIGVSNAIGSYMAGKIRTIATLKCLGAPGRLVFRIYLLQVMALSLGGIAIGLILGAGLPYGAVRLLEGVFPVVPQVGLFPAPLLLAAVFGLLISFTFALWPLARARDIPAAALYRDRIAPAGGWPRRPYVLIALASIVALSALTIFTASDKYFACWFVGGSIVTLLALRGGAALLMAASRRIRQKGSAALRLVLTSIHRPGSATPSIVLSLGVGLSVLVAVALIEGNLNRQINERLPDEAPAFFFVDIQSAQVAGFDETVLGVAGTSGLQRVPTLRGRIVGIGGVPVEEVKIAPGSQWAVRGDRALTYAAIPAKGTNIIAGQWWQKDYRGPPVISLDAGLARGFGVGLGDTLTLNVLGREIEAKITSLREIDWRTLRFDFAIIFAPGTLEGAPHTHIAAVKAPVAIEDAVEKAVSTRYANISPIRVRQALEAAARILAGVGAAVRGSAGITILAGALVLAGTIAAARRRRIYDSVVYKVLGATRGLVLRAYLLEYGILGLATGLIAAAIGSLTAWAVVVHLMRMEWTYLPDIAALTVLTCVIITIAVGFAGTWRVLGQKAAPYLRNE